jgi:hypothetical protein
VHWYAASERAVRLLSETRSDVASLELVALGFSHLALPAAPADRPLSGVRMHLEPSGFAPGNRLHLRIHDPFNPWRALAEADVVSSDAGPVDVAIELQPYFRQAASCS